MHDHRWISLGFAMLIGLASPAAAAAGPPGAPLPKTAAERAAVAEALFDQGKRLMIAGRFSEACDRFIDSERIDHGVGTLLNLADCYEQNGQTASAWAEFRTAAAAASAAGQAEREQIARERERRLLPRLVRLTISISRVHVVPGLIVMRDDLVVDPPLWGLPVPIDPGDHTLVVSAPGKRPYSRIIKVSNQGGASITAAVPALTDLPEDASSTSPLATKTPGLRAQQIAGIAAAGVGVAGIIVGAALGGVAISNSHAAAPHCRGDLCDPEGTGFRRASTRAATASTVALIVAGAAFAAGAALYFTTPKRVPVRALLGVGVTASETRVLFGATW